MRFIKTLTIELHDDGQKIGDIWGLTEERATEIGEMLAEWIKQSSRWSEIYKRIFTELDGNEAMYAFGLLNYMWGREDGAEEATKMILSALESGEAGA